MAPATRFDHDGDNDARNGIAFAICQQGFQAKVVRVDGHASLRNGFHKCRCLTAAATQAREFRHQHLTNYLSPAHGEQLFHFGPLEITAFGGTARFGDNMGNRIALPLGYQRQVRDLPSVILSPR
jgi:hypothetical protein